MHDENFASHSNSREWDASIIDVLRYLKENPALFTAEPDSVDKTPTFEFYPSTSQVLQSKQYFWHFMAMFQRFNLIDIQRFMDQSSRIHNRLISVWSFGRSPSFCCSLNFTSPACFIWFINRSSTFGSPSPRGAPVLEVPRWHMARQQAEAPRWKDGYQQEGT